jgi:hypothetical protein
MVRAIISIAGVAIGGYDLYVYLGAGPTLAISTITWRHRICVL